MPVPDPLEHVSDVPDVLPTFVRGARQRWTSRSIEGSVIGASVDVLSGSDDMIAAMRLGGPTLYIGGGHFNAARPSPTRARALTSERVSRSRREQRIDTVHP